MSKIKILDRYRVEIYVVEQPDHPFLLKGDKVIHINDDKSGLFLHWMPLILINNKLSINYKNDAPQRNVAS